MRDRHKEKIVSIDFDGVLAQYEGYKGDETTGAPIQGALEFVIKLKENGYTPVVHTARATNIVEKRLIENQFPSLEVTNIKYPSVVYIDDRCIQFDGNYDNLAHQMKDFDVYRRKKDKKLFEDLDI